MKAWQSTLAGAHAAYAWAAPFDDSLWLAFVTEVAAYLEPRGRPVRVKRSGVSTARADGPEVDLELHALAARCLRASRPVWSTLISEHFAALLAPPDFPAQFDYRDIAQAKGRLKMRLCTPAEQQARGDLPMVKLPVAPGLVAVLTYDLPAGPCSVPPQDYERWGQPEASLYATGLANLRQSQDAELTPRKLPSGATMQMLKGDSPYISAQLLVLEELLDAPSPYGSVACVPVANLLLFHQILDDRVRLATQELGKLAAMLHQRGPDPLSPHVYWVRKGAFKLLPMEVNTHGVTFTPPAGFTTRVLNPLGA